MVSVIPRPPWIPDVELRAWCPLSMRWTPVTEKHSEVIAGLVVSRKQNGRCIYSARAKHALVEACLRPGVSVARTALINGVNANLVRKWIRAHLAQRQAAPQPGAVASAAVALLPVTRVSERVLKRAPVERQAATESCIEIILSQVTLRLRGRVDAQQLREVMDCVIGRS
jgi:transposase